MVSALLHQYAPGDLVNIEEARKLFRKTSHVQEEPMSSRRPVHPGAVLREDILKPLE